MNTSPYQNNATSQNRHVQQVCQLSKRKISLYIVLIFILGFGISTVWNSLQNPMRPLYVEVVNATDKIIPTVIIEHGSTGLQEKIILVQLKPSEKRIIALNHKPGMGFNVAAFYSNDDKTEICAGKNKDKWFFRETITKFGIYTTALR